MHGCQFLFHNRIFNIIIFIFCIVRLTDQSMDYGQLPVFIPNWLSQALMSSWHAICCQKMRKLVWFFFKHLKLTVAKVKAIGGIARPAIINSHFFCFQLQHYLSVSVGLIGRLSSPITCSACIFVQQRNTQMRLCILVSSKKLWLILVSCF